MSFRASWPLLLLVICLAACDDESGSTDAGANGDSDSGVDGSVLETDAAPDAEPNQWSQCASTFGDALTAPFGRLDGTVLAVIQPGNEMCPRPNSDHVILEVTSGGEAYRMVINVASTRGTDRDVRLLETHAALPGPAWEDGWHTDAPLDYVNTLSVHSNDEGWTAYGLEELSDRVASDITVGQHVSVYASTDGGDSAHLIHRNHTNEDGAVVLDADGENPTWLLFHFATQTF